MAPSNIPVYPGAETLPKGAEFGAKVHKTLMGLPGGAPLLSDTRTGIQATRKTYSERAASPSPDESTLGAPIYPGAVCDSDQSRTMAGGGRSG